MQTFTRPVYLAHQETALREHLRAVLQHPFELVPVRDLSNLRAKLLSAPPTAVCFVDPFAGGSRCLDEELYKIRRDYPTLGVVAALRVTPDDAVNLRTLVEWGVAEILDLARDNSPIAVLKRFHDVRVYWAHSIFSQALPTLSTRARTMLHVIADVAASGGTVVDLANALTIDERTVPRWCERAGLPPARRLLAWSRLLLAAHLLEDRKRSVESVARMCGYAGASPLGATLHAFAGARPGELRKSRPFEHVAEKFRDEIRAWRESASTFGDNRWLN